jgi:hypothetical protein
MSCARATTRDMKRLFVLSSVMVGLGCMRVSEVGPPDPSNPLPRGVQASEADFLKQIDPYKPIINHPDPRDRTAKGTCLFGWCPRTSIRIEAVGDTYTINPKNPPAIGRPVAHLVNLGNKVEKHYGLVPNGKGQVDYYFWVDAKSPTQAQWTLLQLSHVTHTVTAALPTDLNYCHIYKQPTPTSDADFAQYRPEGPCDVPKAEARAKISQASLIPVSALIALLQHMFVFLQLTDFALSDGAWIYCSNGCCT